MSEQKANTFDKKLHWKCNHFSELTKEELHQCMALRQEVFILEQRCFYLDADHFDIDAYHLRVLEENGKHTKLIAYLRVYFEQASWHIGRVLVIKERRGQGLGKQLMLRCHQELARLNQHFNASIELSAQLQVVKFYESLGYTTFGEQYEDAGISHQKMRLDGAAQSSMNLLSLSTIIFDFDGTLVDSAYDYAVSFQSLTREWNSSLPMPDPEKIKELMFAGVRPQIEYSLGPLEDADYFRALELFRVKCMQTPIEHTAPYLGIIDLLDTLQNVGYRLAICTNRPQDLCIQALDRLGLSNYFELVVGGDRGLERKPNPEMLFEIFNKLRVDARSCVLVGDSLVDVTAAEAADCMAIAVHWGYTPTTAFKELSNLLQVSQVNELKSLLVR